MNGKFSDRIGMTQPVTSIQVESMNEELQNSIWNVILEILDVRSVRNHQYLKRGLELITRDFLKKPVDALPNHPTE